MKKSLLLFPLLAFQLILAQSPGTIRHLVFEGAGIRGIAYCGAVQEMESNKMIGNIKKVGGTSSGAIVALTISLGYTGKEIETIISQTNFKKLNDGKYFFIGGINRMNKYFGYYRGKKITQWLEKLIKAKPATRISPLKKCIKKDLKICMSPVLPLINKSPLSFPMKHILK